jgi:hypothetical protein
MPRPKSTFLLLISLLAFSWLSSSALWKTKSFRVKGVNVHSSELTTLSKAREKAKEAKRFATSEGFNTEKCFLIDMSLPSSQNRFFVFNFANDSITKAGLVTHGRCNEFWLEGRRYGNTVGCGCTSLGKYKIGYSYYGKFGLAFKLYGLDKTNDKAFQRYVVLHAHSCVPDQEVSDEICQSDGCPTVSPPYLQYLKNIIKASKKPVLLWIYE